MTDRKASSADHFRETTKMVPCEPLTPEETANLNPGIRETVTWLRSVGFETTDSGDGATSDFECDVPFPYVYIEVDPWEMIGAANRLASLLGEQGVGIGPVADDETINIQATYDAATGTATLMLIGMDDAALRASRETAR